MSDDEKYEKIKEEYRKLDYAGLEAELESVEPIATRRILTSRILSRGSIATFFGAPLVAQLSDHLYKTHLYQHLNEESGALLLSGAVLCGMASAIYLIMGKNREPIHRYWAAQEVLQEKGYLLRRE